MTIKNFLVQTLIRVNSTDYGWKDRSDEGDLYNLYKQLQLLSKSSYKHFLQGEWEYVLLETEVNNVLDVFRYNFKSIHDLKLKHGPCNILFCGLDTQMLKPTEIFGQFENFMMFNYTDPKRTNLFPHNFNCDVRYYPAEMPDAWWEFSLEEEAKIKIWEDEQNIYNAMLWSQGLESTDVLHPKLAYQGFMMADHTHNRELADNWNGIKFEDAQIVHWHSSRGAQNRIDTMTKLAQELGIPLLTE